MLQTNSIWIVENERQLKSIHLLKTKLLYKEALLQEECDIATLPNYDMVFFLLTPTQIGNKFFIDAIKEILHVRKNSKTIFLAIDDCYQLDNEEIVKVILELKASIKELITNPNVFTVSSYYAALHHQYEIKKVSLEELRQNRDVIISTDDGELLTGRKLEEDHVKQLLKLSKMEKFYQLVQDFSKGLQLAGIDVTKKNWLVLGPENTGKSLLTELLKTSVGDSFHFQDMRDDLKDVGKYYDGLVIVLDLDILKNLDYLEKICSTYVGIEKIIVVNKIDNFMFFQKSQQMLKMDIKKKISSFTSDPIYFVSSYYFHQYLQLKKEEITVEDLIQNPNVVLVDALNFPISKEKNKTKLQELLFNQSGFGNLLQNWE
ncbi:hypothetical protein [Ureibacillus sp. FSL K6-2830]|uniref:hypothetical protein n=1 Tax=Ureibacillus sp. FSL K6-2830 TaxID=2954610 RepID=UPI0030FC5F5B